jgi:hypothetical protein
MEESGSIYATTIVREFFDGAIAAGIGNVLCEACLGRYSGTNGDYGASLDAFVFCMLYGACFNTFNAVF